jgi:Flp pilus assembly protein TadD
VSYVAYLGKLVFPADLCLPYDYDPASLTPVRVAAAVAFLLGVSVLVVRAARSRPYLAVGWGWYVVSLLPVVGLVQVGNQAMADRYTYVPLIGPTIMIAWGARDLLEAARLAPRPRRILLAGLAGVSVLALAGCGFVQVRHWRSSRALFTHTLEVDPRNPTAHTCLAMGFADEGRIDEAIHHHREAIAREPGNTFSRKHLGILLSKRSEDREAVPLLEASLSRYPDDAVALGFLGTSLLRLGRTAEAQAAFEASLRLDPTDVAVHQNLAVLFLQQGSLDRAIDHLTEAVRLSPNDAAAREALAQALAKAE